MPKYEILTANNYLEGVKAIKILGEQGELDQKYHHDEKRGWRPLSLKETIQVIVEAYNLGDKSLPENDISTTSGIAYETYTDCNKDRPRLACLMKIIPVSEDLLNPEDTESGKIKIDYSSLDGKNEIEGGVYFCMPSKLQKRMEDCWLKALEGDEELLREYAKIVSKERGSDVEPQFQPDDCSNFIDNTISPLSIRYSHDAVAIFGYKPLTQESNFIIVPSS